MQYRHRLKIRKDGSRHILFSPNTQYFILSSGYDSLTIWRPVHSVHLIPVTYKTDILMFCDIEDFMKFKLWIKHDRYRLPGLRGVYIDT